MEIKIGDDFIINDPNAKISIEPTEEIDLELPEDMTLEKECIIFEHVYSYPVTPPHPYNVLLLYWYFQRDCCILIQGSDKEYYYL